jgi:DNA-binding NtrC family response regulator
MLNASLSWMSQVHIAVTTPGKDLAQGLQDAVPLWKAVMHVLVVDNDWDTRDLVYYALSHAGYKVSQARGVAEALRLSHQHPDIGVVVADMRLDHQVTGMEMAGKMRQSLCNSHYILASGDWDVLGSHCPEDISVLRKPYGKADLLRAVRNGATTRHGLSISKKSRHNAVLLA